MQFCIPVMVVTFQSKYFKAGSQAALVKNDDKINTFKLFKQCDYT